jgi:lipid A 3-O-deacylase
MSKIVFKNRFSMRSSLCIALSTFFAALPLSGHAADFSGQRVDTAFRLLDEIRAGAYIHSPGYKEGDTLSLSGELLTSPIQTGFSNPVAAFIFGPRLNLGFTANVEGFTSFAYTGFTWTYDVTERLFLEASFGGGIHNGELEPPVANDRLTLGCRVLFREGATAGFRVTQSWSVMASVEHLSHAGLCSDFNNGITTAGARVGYTF